MSKLIFAGGGTGGHLYPGLAVADSFRLSGHPLGAEILFVGTRRGIESRIVPERGYSISYVRARGLTGGWTAALRAAVETLVGLVQSLGLMLVHRPRLVVGTGGYASAPVVLAAALVGVPTVVLEQNALPGKTTRLLSRFARKVCVSFPETAAWFPESKVVVTGNPVRTSILEMTRQQGLEALGVRPDRRCLLVTGASQGATSLNSAVLASLRVWRDRAWTVLHLTGPDHADRVRREAAPLVEGGNLDYRCYGYLENMAAAYAVADLVVGRAGATTVAELTARGLPAILVPYPLAAEAHQEKNASAMVREGAAVLLSDQEVEPRLCTTVLELMTDDARLREMHDMSRSLGRPDALRRIVSLCEELVQSSCGDEALGRRVR